MGGARAHHGFANDPEVVTEQHRPGTGIVHSGDRPQAPEAVAEAGQVAGPADGFGSEAAARELAANAVTDLGFAVADVDEVDPADDRAVVGDQDVEAVGARGLHRQQGVVTSGIVGEELVAPVRDRRGEVLAVDRLELEDGLEVLGRELLQVHARDATLAGWKPGRPRRTRRVHLRYDGCG